MTKTHLKTDDPASEMQLNDIIEFLPDATFVIDRNKRVIVWNQAMAELTGIPAADILGKGDFEYSLPFFGERRPILIDLVTEPDDMIRKYHPQFTRSRDAIIAEGFFPSLQADGTYLCAIAKPLYSRNGAVVGVIESLRDITKRKIAENTVLVQKQELEKVNRALSATIRQLRIANAEYKDANERLEAAQRDYIAANERLRESEEKFATAFRLCPVVLTLSTVAEGRYVEVSEHFYKATGYTKEEVIGSTSFDLGLWVNPEDRGRILKKLRNEGRVLNKEIQFRDKEGTVIAMLLSAEFLTIRGVAYLLTLNFDITERKRSEELIRRQKEELEAVNRELKDTLVKMEDTNSKLLRAQRELVSANENLRHSEEKFSKAFHLGPICMTLSNFTDGCYVEASDFFLKITGYSREEVIGRSSLDLDIWANPEDRDQVLAALKTDGVVRDRKYLFRSKAGKIYVMLYSAEVVQINDAPHIVSVAIDITDREKAKDEKEQLERQLQQAQKMESIGRLAGGVAHDFNNLLTAILGNVELLMLKTDPRSAVHSTLEVVMKAADSAADLTRQLLAFSRKQVIEPQLIDLNRIIAHMQKMLTRLIGEDIRLSTRLTPEPARIKADPGQIEQIIVNLAVNARDAMPDGGRLVLETAEVSLDAENCICHPGARPGRYITLIVSDTGEGMTDDIQKKIFEPFFTTKSQGKGTGLGLATVYGAVKQNCGDIEVYSMPDKGTTFKIFFPYVSDDGASMPSEETGTAPSKGNGETILLVEDAPLVRDFAVHALNQLGYRVLEASDGQSAISIGASHGGKIHLLLTDVIMPGLNGRQLADKLKQSRPDLKVMFTSGYTSDVIAHHGILEKGIHFISKPYSIHSLSKKIRDILGR